jgi:hypothetical protein
MSRDEALERFGVAEDFEKAWRRQMKVNHVGGWLASGGTLPRKHISDLDPTFLFPSSFRILEQRRLHSNISKQLFLCESTVGTLVAVK